MKIAVLMCSLTCFGMLVGGAYGTSGCYGLDLYKKRIYSHGSYGGYICGYCITDNNSRLNALPMCGGPSHYNGSDCVVGTISDVTLSRGYDGDTVGRFDIVEYCMFFENVDNYYDWAGDGNNPVADYWWGDLCGFCMDDPDAFSCGTGMWDPDPSTREGYENGYFEDDGSFFDEYTYAYYNDAEAKVDWPVLYSSRVEACVGGYTENRVVTHGESATGCTHDYALIDGNCEECRTYVDANLPENVKSETWKYSSGNECSGEYDWDEVMFGDCSIENVYASDKENHNSGVCYVDLSGICIEDEKGCFVPNADSCLDNAEHISLTINKE